MDLIDFDSDEGFVQATGKTKKKASTPFNSADLGGDKKDDVPEEGADGNNNQNTGDGGGSGNAGGNGDDGGDKKDDDQKNGPEAGDDDNIWDLAPAGNKKKDNKKSSDATDIFGLPKIASSDFHEIKLDDAGGGQDTDSLDLSLFPKADKITSGLTAWTSSWTTGSWGWRGLKSPGGSDIPKPSEDEKPKSPDPAQTNPWSVDSGKSKKKEPNAFAFGSLAENGNKKDDSFDFMGSSKQTEKKDIGSSFSWGATPTKTADKDFGRTLGDTKSKEEEKSADAEVADDIWGFSSAKKDKKKKNTSAVVGETPTTENSLPEAPDPPQAGESLVDDAARQAEAALVAQEEAELRKLQTRKDIGNKLTKKQQERLKVLTENVKAREEAAAAAVETKEQAAPSAEADSSVDLIQSEEAAASADPDAPQAEADEKALIIQEEEDEMYILRSTNKLKKAQKDRLIILEERAEERAREAEDAAARKEQDKAMPEIVGLTEPPVKALPAKASDDAQAEADEKARIIREEDELAQLLAKRKLKKGEKDRVRILEQRANGRVREAEEAAAALADAPDPENSGDATESKTDQTTPTSVDDAFGDVDKDEAALLIEEEEELELEILLAKTKLKKADKARLKELQDNKERREQEATDKTDAEAEVLDTVDSTPLDDAPAGGDKMEDPPISEDEELAARIAEEEELELELLLSKSRLNKAEKARLKVLQDKKEQREREAAHKAEVASDAPPAGETVVEEPPPASVPEHESVDEASIQREKKDAQIIAEESELSELLSKNKLKKADKARLKELEDRKEQRDSEAAEREKAEAPTAEDAPLVEDPPRATESKPVDEAAIEKEKENAKIAAEESELSDLLSKFKLKKAEKARLKELQDRKEQRDREAVQEDNAKGQSAEEPLTVEEPPAAASGPGPVDETALQKEKEHAVIAAEESELFDLLSKAKLKKSEKARVMELQDRKDARDDETRLAAEKAEEEARLAREAAEQEARDLEEQQKREAAEKLAAEIAAEDAEISSLESKKKLKVSEKKRLMDLKARRDERARTEDATKEDSENDTSKKEPLSWADDDPAQGNGVDDTWMNWGGLTTSSKPKKTSKEEPVPEPPAVDPVSRKSKEDDSWDAWGTGKKDKKTSKNNHLIDFGGTDETPAVPDPPPPVPEIPGFDFGWGKPTPKEEPSNEIWGFGSSSKKKKTKGDPVAVVEDTHLASTIMPDPVAATNDRADDDLWSTFGTKKSNGDQKAKDKKSGSSKEDLVADIPLPIPSPIDVDLTATEEGNGAGTVSDDLSASTKTSNSKSSAKEPKLSKKELEKMEKEKKKAEKEQKAREEQEAKDAAELARLEEEERLEAEAKAEQERLAQEEADRIRKEEEEKQAVLDAIAKEEADLAVLQAKKDSGKKLLKKEKEQYDKLSASCQARADEKAAQEAAEQAAREEAERLQREAEAQALREAIEKEESELKDLQKKKDSGRKLLKKDKERYDVLTANKKARRQAEIDAEAALQAEAVKEEPAAGEFADPLEKDLDKLDANELEELDAFLSAPPKAAATTKKAADVDAFSFWGASKKPAGSSKKDKSVAAEPHMSPLISTTPTSPALASISISFGGCRDCAHAESSSSCKLLEATMRVSGGGTKDATRYAVATSAGALPSAGNDSSSPPSQLPVVEQPSRDGESPATAEPVKRKAGAGKSKIADRLKALEAVPPPPPPPPPPADPLPPPPPLAPVAAAENVKSKRSSKNVDVPGSFPDDFEEGHPDDIIEVIEMPVRTRKSSKKSSSKAKADDAPIAIPPPPPAVPDAPPLSPPPEVKKDKKKERPKINRDGGASWGTWTASTPREKEKKSSSKSKSAGETNKAPKEERAPEKEEKLSSKSSSSDKAERADKKDKDLETTRPKIKSVFASTPPISRSTSTRDRRHKEGRSSRRPSIDVNSGMMSPPPEDMPDPGSKAARILGIGLGRSSSKRKNSVRPGDDEDIVMVGATDAESPEKSSRRRASKSYHRDDDIVMVDAADATPTPAPGLKRSNTTGSSAKKGFGGLFGGILNRPEPKRRNTYHTDGEDAGAATDVDAEARKAARRARRAEREVVEKSKDEMRRDKRRKQEAEAEAQQQAEKEARRAERHAARERGAGEDKDERRRRKRAERETVETDAEAEARRARHARRKARAAGESDRENDEERRRRRADKRSGEGRAPPTRRRTEEDDFVYPRPTKVSRRHTDGLDNGAAGAGAAPKAAEGWPHSGTSSWVQGHSDAGPPPEDGGEAPRPEDSGMVDENAARRERRRRRQRSGRGDVEVDGEERRRRHQRGAGGEERSEGGDERRRERRAAAMVSDSGGGGGGGGGGRGSSGGGFGGLWKKLTGN